MIQLTTWDLHAAIQSYSPGYKLSRIPIPKLRIEIQCDVTADALALLTGKDGSRLQQELFSLCNKAYAERLPTILEKLNRCNANCASASDNVGYCVKLLSTVEDEIMAELGKAREEALKRVNQCFTAYGQRRRGATLYVVSLWAKAVGSAVGAATSALLLAGGPLALIGIYVMYRSFVEGAELIADSLKDAESVRQEVEEGLKALNERYKAGPAVRGVKDFEASVVNALKPPPGVENWTVEKLEEKVGSWKNKTDMLDNTASYLGGKLKSLLATCEKLETQLVNDPDSDKKKAALETTRNNVNLLLKDGYWIPRMGRRVTIDDAHVAVRKGEEAQKKVREAIELLRKQQPIPLGIIDVVMKAGLLIANPADLNKAMDIAGFVNDSASYLVTCFGVGYDIGEEAFKTKVREIEENEKREREQAIRPRLNAAEWERPFRGRLNAVSLQRKPG